MIEKLDETNFLLFAAKHYENPECFDTDEFLVDLNRFKYVRRLLNKYSNDGTLKETLILNHIIVIYNVFGVGPATRMLFFRLSGLHKYLKPFLSYLGYLPKAVEGIGFDCQTIICDQIESDLVIEKALKEI